MSFINKKIRNTETALIVMPILFAVFFYLFLFLNNVWSLLFILGLIPIIVILFLAILNGLHKLFYKKDNRMIRPLLFVLTVFLILFFRLDKFFVGQIDESEYLLVAFHKAPLGFVTLEIFRDSTFVFSKGGLGCKIDYRGKVAIRNDSLFFNYFDSIPTVGSKAVLTKDKISYEKYRLENIYINRLIEKDSIE